MSAQTQQSPAPDTAYRTLLKHTMACERCRAGAPCATGTQLRHAWRRDR